MAYKKQNKPVIGPPSHKRKDKPPLDELASLARAAPLTLRCMGCGTPRCADANRIVLWHPDVADPAFECAGAGAPGLDMEEMRNPE